MPAQQITPYISVPSEGATPWTKSTILQNKHREHPVAMSGLWCCGQFLLAHGKFNSWLTTTQEIKSKNHQFLDGPQVYIYIHGSLKHFRVGNSWVTLATWSNNDRSSYSCCQSAQHGHAKLYASAGGAWYHLRSFLQISSVHLYLLKRCGKVL